MREKQTIWKSDSHLWKLGEGAVGQHRDVAQQLMDAVTEEGKGEKKKIQPGAHLIQTEETQKQPCTDILTKYRLCD